jgi:antitoxin MazE
VRVAKWGNSLAVRLPAAVIDALRLREGEDVELHVLGERALAVARTPDREALLERLRGLRGSLPADFKFDREQANER